MCQLASLDDTACEVAETRHNARLNRYFNVLPFDYNRVQLSVRLSPPGLQHNCLAANQGTGCRISWPCKAATGLHTCQIPGRCQTPGSWGLQTGSAPQSRQAYTEIY